MAGITIDSMVAARRAGLVAGLAILATVAPLRSWAAGPDDLPLPSLPAARIPAGRTVLIRWPELPPGVEEMEVLLAVDGDRYVLRASPELEGQAIQVAWRVPNLATSTARLRLRARIRGIEVEGPPGPAFEIVARADRPAELDLVHEGDWWPGIDRASTLPTATMDSRAGLRLRSGGAAPGLLSPAQCAAPGNGSAAAERLSPAMVRGPRPPVPSRPSRLEVPRRE